LKAILKLFCGMNLSNTDPDYGHIKVERKESSVKKKR
jgi:hypothetical protein